MQAALTRTHDHEHFHSHVIGVGSHFIFGLNVIHSNLHCMYEVS